MSVNEVLVALRMAEGQLQQACGDLVRSRQALHEARTALARIDPDHPETVVPIGFGRADDQLEHVLNTVERCTEVIRTYATTL